MKISRDWLQKYFHAPLPSAQELADALTFHAFEIESVEGDILDVKITANRGHDCLSYRGIAKEVSAILKLPLSSDPLDVGLTKSHILEPVTDSVSVLIEDIELSPRYIAGLMKGVKVGPSPEWLVKRLESMGQKSINNVVDATNFVMFNIGQPLHAFDADKVKGNIIIRQLEKGDHLSLLKTTIQIEGGKEAGWNRHIAQTQDKGALAICDDSGPIALAGIKGGSGTAINEATTSLILEAANFNGKIVRWASKMFNISTDASQRFQQGLSPELAAFGMRAAADLIHKLAGGEIVGFADAYAKPHTPLHVTLQASHPTKVLGVEISKETIRGVFTRLGFSFEEKEESFVVTVPFERLDIQIPEDLIEEIARIEGFDTIPSIELPVAIAPVAVNQNFYASEWVREHLASEGYSEVITSVFADTGERAVLNKVDSVRPKLRSTLVDGLNDALKKNIQNKDLLGLTEVKLFEIGTVWKGGKEEVMAGIVTEKEKAKEDPLSVFAKEATEYETLPLSETERYQSFSRYPSITRDIAMWVPAESSSDDVKNVLKENAGSLSVRIDLFDEFKKEDKISYAFRLVFQSSEKTLTDDEVNAEMQRVYGAVDKKGWNVR